jgi:uncharacterized hydantoinase/oxoprolinase family protein
MADVYRLTGELNEAHDQTDAADGQEKTLKASARRLSRMIACDFKVCDLALWQQFAVTLKLTQKRQIQHACQRQLTRTLVNNSRPMMIGAGIGRFLVKQIATDLGLAYQDFDQLCDINLSDTTLNLTVADCAPAVAVAYLAQNIQI